jgi:prepilin-type N-terminal cleavage/methylation domain-containing protein
MAIRGFTLVELLVVVAIISIAMALALNLPTSDRKMADVSAAANELAGTLRLARSLALERQAVHAVSFHIQNGVGTSGAVINNWDGNHWYRLVGPSLETSVPAPPEPTRLNTSYGTGYNVVKVVRGVSRSWQGGARRLPARKVRFLALTDQDNGHAHDWKDTGAVFGQYPPTYPRPWCGWWDATSGRLRAWGGYDPLLTDGKGRANSGFYYQGQDGVITGCVTPAGRTRVSTLTQTEVGAENIADGSTTLLTADAARPLVNGDWLDCRIVFYPDGRVEVPGFMELRYWSRRAAGNGGGNAISGWGDLGDLYPEWKDWWNHYAYEQPATWFNEASGYWYITLAPDVASDSDAFPDVHTALRSMTPCFRVGISRIGDVRVVQVRNRLSGVLDTAITVWQDRTQTKATYARGMRSDANGRLVGAPVVDALVPEMLTKRSWWYAP